MKCICIYRKKETAGGGLLEFGAFGLQVCQLAFQQEPKSVKATGTLNENGVDVDVSAKLVYGDNKVATFRVSMMENRSNSAKIIGTKGQILVNIFCVSRFDFNGFNDILDIFYALFSDSDILVVPNYNY